MRACAVAILAVLLFTCCSAKKPEDKAKEEYLKGVAMLREKKMKEAIEIFQQVRDRYPDTEWGQKARKDLVFYEDAADIYQFSKQLTAKDDIIQIARACEFYKARTNSYPDGLNVLMPEYLKKVYKDPWGRSYLYMVERRSGGRQSYTLACFGEDQMPGGDGDSMDVILEDSRFTVGSEIGGTQMGTEAGDEQ
ncbi:MAG: type II secretion system protein GspG [Acidobacteriota bacterium]